MGVILAQLYPKPSGLNSDGGIALRIETRGASQHFGRNLVFLQSDAGVIEGVFREITEQLAEGFRAVEAMAFGKSLYLLEALLPTDNECVCYSHRTGR
jgi:hypothetical protein